MPTTLQQEIFPDMYAALPPVFGAITVEPETALRCGDCDLWADLEELTEARLASL